ncbi:MAG: CHAT domain-containing protein [Ktedonobacterales bacterium]
MMRVLVVLANPRGTDSLRLMTEERTIRECFALSREQDKLLARVLPASTIHDVRRALLRDPYQVIHFSGHGTGRGLALEDERGQAQTVPYRALAGLLDAHSPPLECAVLNACYTSGFGAEVSFAIPYVIGMGTAISDPAATEFARGFYDAVAAGRDYEFAFAEGKRAIGLADIPEASVPMLWRSPTLYLQQLFRQAMPDSVDTGVSRLPRWLKGDLLEVLRRAVELAAASPAGRLTMRHVLVALLQLEGGVCAYAIRTLGGDPARIITGSRENLETALVPCPRVEPTESVWDVLVELGRIGQDIEQKPDDGWILLAALGQDPASVTIVELLEDLECDEGDLKSALLAARAHRDRTPPRKRGDG